MDSTADDLRRRLPELMLRDEHRLRRRLDKAREADELARIAADVERSAQRVARRRAAVPRISYPEQLPVSQRRDDLLEVLASSQVVVVAGETGSGKTTQLPKLLLELGRGVRGSIAHTQPRRLAARTVAERIAEELDVPLGDVVGYKVRFTDRSGDDTLVKLMTDGILLAELQRDRDLRGYDTIVVDEAHERSLNIDFLLGYLAQLLPRRPDLKVVITSATIATARFSEHFGGAPVVEVTGRTHPVEVRYRPLVADTGDDGDDDAEPRDQVTAVCDAVVELQAEGPGDVLVFLSGEREIRDTADALPARVREGTEVLPLYARLSAGDQHRVFSPSRGNRVVLATNVAETSLTVPGIRYVVDAGTARISRYSVRTKVQRLPIEAVSQASANQRAGRCGRVAAGVCIRLYTEDDYRARPPFTDPEILRTNLASVILQMTALGLGDVAAFPFVDPPDRRNVKDGYDLLHELGAVDPRDGHRLTEVGRRLARLPVDPRLGRMVLEADRRGCVHEVLVLAAALTVQDPRERPVDEQAKAAQLHARFRDEASDFTAYLNLWRYLQEQQDELSSSAFRRLCKRELLHYLRVREWQDLYGQLRSTVRELGLHVDTSSGADPRQVHRALLAGLLSHVGLRDDDKGGGREFAGARGARFAVFPGSSLARKPPRWVVAAELVETSRLFARVVARTEPGDVEALAQHLVKRSYSEPHWSKDRAGVVAVERVTLYGLPLVVGRTVDYGRIDPELSRELFLRQALVEGDWDTRHPFFAANRALLEQAGGLEDRLRRRDLVIDDEALFAFYDARVPADVVSGRHFDAWWKSARHEAPGLLTLTLGDLVSADAAPDALDYPDVWLQGDLRLDLHYVFEPGAPEDGLTVDVPVAVLNRVDGDDLAWQVPGLRGELVTALLRTLPKQHRRQLGPAPDRAAAVLALLRPREEPLLDGLERALRQSTGVLVARADWDLARVPPHLRPSFRVHDEQGRVLDEGRDLEALRRRFAPRTQKAIAHAASGLERTGLTGWTLGTLPRTVEVGAVRGYPALVDEGATVGVRVLGSADAQAAAHRVGVRRLLLLQLPSPLKAVVGRMPNTTKLALTHNPYGSVPALLDDCVAAAVDALVLEAGGPPWDAEGFDRVRDAVRPQLERAVEDLVRVVGTVLAASHEVDVRLRSLAHPQLLPAVTDVRAQVAVLVGAGFASRTGRRRLDAVLRYLQAVQRRLDRLSDDVERDRRGMREVHQLQQEYAELVASLPPERRTAADVVDVRWMLEELRVSLFAQPLKTAYPVSEKRVLKAMDALLG